MTARQDLLSYLVGSKDVVVDAPEVLDGLEALHDFYTALVGITGVAVLLRSLAVIPEAVPVLGREHSSATQRANV